MRYEDYDAEWRAKLDAMRSRLLAHGADELVVDILFANNWCYESPLLAEYYKQSDAPRGTTLREWQSDFHYELLDKAFQLLNCTGHCA